MAFLLPAHSIGAPAASTARKSKAFASPEIAPRLAAAYIAYRPQIESLRLVATPSHNKPQQVDCQSISIIVVNWRPNGTTAKLLRIPLNPTLAQPMWG
ncbi:MAG: hypothetical protein ACI4AM_03395 [Muribaculaceae bacterium]